jgi:hypothetical protein
MIDLVSHQVDSGPARKASSTIFDSILYGLSMEGTQPKTRGRKPASLTQSELIIEAWERLDRAPLGERELSEIQRSVREQSGAGDLSPAAIARVLADEGAELRHPEVIEFDARWRETKIESESGNFEELEGLLAGKPLRLSKAEALIKRLERLRLRGDEQSEKEARRLAVSGRQLAELLAKDGKLDKLQRAEEAEIAEWLKVWIQTPGLFADWLELRRRSPEFRKKFLG